MQSLNTTWEDETNNRQIELSVDYSMNGNELNIHRLTPTKVIIRRDDGAATRSINVHSRRGRMLLANAVAISRIKQQILDEIPVLA